MLGPVSTAGEAMPRRLCGKNDIRRARGKLLTVEALTRRIDISLLWSAQEQALGIE
jgi:hypothetical protein